MSTEKLESIDAQTSLTKREEESISSSIRHRILSAAETFDIDKCAALVGTALAAMEPVNAIRQVLSPVMREVGDRWECGDMTVSEEHLLTATVKRLLFSSIDMLGRAANNQIVAFATLRGERHELGCLFAAYLASIYRLKCCYFGPDVPAVDLAASIRGVGARAIGISLASQPNGVDLLEELSTLRKCLPSSIQVWVGGGEVSNLKIRGLPSGCDDLTNLDTYAARLELMRHEMPKT